VVPRGEGGGLYLTTTGVGMRPNNRNFGLNLIRPGDLLMVSGPVGDHAIAVMLAREDFDRPKARAGSAAALARARKSPKAG
jgi:hydrogenase expression/formation protein HypE